MLDPRKEPALGRRSWTVVIVLVVSCICVCVCICIIIDSHGRSISIRRGSSGGRSYFFRYLNNIFFLGFFDRAIVLGNVVRFSFDGVSGRHGQIGGITSRKGGEMHFKKRPSILGFDPLGSSGSTQNARTSHKTHVRVERQKTDSVPFSHDVPIGSVFCAHDPVGCPSVEGSFKRFFEPTEQVMARRILEAYPWQRQRLSYNTTVLH